MSKSFDYKQYEDDYDQRRAAEIEGSFMRMEINIHNNLPDSRERSLAMTKLEECGMWINKCLDRNGFRGGETESGSSD